MIRSLRSRIILAALMLAALGGLMLLDRASHRCIEAGGHFEASRWTCLPHPPIILQRELERS